ncbi:cytochrome P450 9e2-like isoform X2 [Leptidea sinapis]|uniref:cytochrome P450 9e2-like isoform X2 n=1 Tax=Leptidea sinapis TaxID=189913 RepID=UPI0021C3F532|nr:cytochrome P450 9e2-like isoform X2 [Leptidea sinapis]
MFIELCVFLVTAFFAYALYNHNRMKNFFTENGLKYKPFYPIFGNNLQSTFKQKHMVEDLDEVYRAFPNEKYVAYMEGGKPHLLIRDPDLIKQITVKDFDHFVDHKEFFPVEVEPLFGNSVFMMKGERWRDMRSTLSPAFTSSKMKLMMPFMTEISNNIVKYIKGSLKTEKGEDDETGLAPFVQNNRSTTKWTPDELAGQVFIFFIAGFESSASTLVLCLHELALNYEVQDKLYQEIRNYEEKNGKLVFEKINELNYLECVLNEALRKWSVALALDRMCTKTYELPPPREGGKPYTMKPGDLLLCTVNSIHMDPKYFPDPKAFNPDRFLEENKHKIKPFTFLPFGAGPRNCIGIRFAMMELKVLLFHLVANFEIQKCEKTQDPAELAPLDLIIAAKGGSWVKFVPRNK